MLYNIVFHKYIVLKKEAVTMNEKISWSLQDCKITETLDKQQHDVII